MKKAAMALVCFSFLFVFCLGVSVAQEKATKEECVAKVKEFVALIKQSGFEAAKAKLMEPNSPFVWKDSYILVQNMDQIMVAHGVNSKLVGKSMKAIKDINGKMFNDEMAQVAASKGEGWVSYVWPKPGEKEPSPKLTYILRVPGENLFVGAGIYE